MLPSRLAPGALAVALALAAASPAAAATPGQTCQAAQLKAAGRFMKTQLKCWGVFQKKLDPDALVSCLEKADLALEDAYEKSLAAAGPGVCGLQVDADELVGDLGLEVERLVDLITGDPGSTKAEQSLYATLLKATGTALASALGAESKHAKSPDEAKRQSARSSARAKLSSAFAKAQAKAADQGVPDTGPPASLVADEVDRITDELALSTLASSFAVSGTIQAAEGSVVDSDVNDPNTSPIANDIGTAQAIPVPAVAGGYVNLAGAGPDGNSQTLGDASDFFSVSLEAGQRVNLRFGDPLNADLDLCLYDAAKTLLDCSVGTSETEELTAPSPGQFYVEVYAFSECACGSSYVLTLGQTLPAAGPSGPRLGDDFVPGEVVVKLADAALPLGARRPPAASSYEAAFGLHALAGSAEREMLFRLPAATAERAATFQALGVDAARSALHAKLGAAPGPQREKLDTLLAVKALARRADVAIAEPNFVYHALAVPNDTHYALQWHYPLINLPAAWDLTTGSDSVEVAVIDTGVLLDHPDLQGPLAAGAGYDFISDPNRANDGGGIDANADDPGDGGGGRPSSFHGTHVAGTIGAATNNASGVAGVAWDVTLVPLRVLGVGGGTGYDIRQAVRYAAGLPNDSGTSHAVDVINLSLGGSGSSALDQAAYTDAREAGVIVIAAAGNNDSSQLFFPASYDGVVSVSAVDLRKQKAPYSNFGSAVDVAAPGGDTSVDRNGDGYVDGVLSTLADEASGLFNFVFYQGTSMAAPHMAGVVALMKAVKPSLAPAELDTLLAGGTITTDLGAAGRDDVFGHGLVDARRAVEAVIEAPADEPILVVTPTGLNLATSQTQASFQVANGAGGTLTVTSVSEVEAWLAVSPSSVDGNGLGTYTVTVDRGGLANGTYSGTISVQSSAGSASVSVVMAVVSAAEGADAGFHYVLIVDPETFETVEQFDVAATAGHYDYQVTNVPGGSYYVFAGSDPDNDFVICANGEACGAYPTLGTPELLEITGDRTDLDFVTGFLQTLEAGATSAGPEPPKAGLRRLRSRQLAR